MKTDEEIIAGLQAIQVACEERRISFIAAVCMPTGVDRMWVGNIIKLLGLNGIIAANLQNELIKPGKKQYLGTTAADQPKKN